MIDSLSNTQVALILCLGEWRDEGHCFAVAPYGEVSSHPAINGDNHDATEQREGAARRQGSPGRQGATGESGAATPPEPAGQDRRTNVRDAYLAAMPEVRDYYPDLRVAEVEDGIWAVTKIFPIGRDGPFFSVCLFLPDGKNLDAVAFAFHGDGTTGRPVGPRHTNFPDGSICAFSPDDGVWRPGASPLVLMNLYAEWLLCQLYLELEAKWPGRQSGLNALYRQQEFQDAEWCDCGRQLRYGNCCKRMDASKVAVDRIRGTLLPLPNRLVPSEVVTFAKSSWRTPPKSTSLDIRKFVDPMEASVDLLKRRLARNTRRS